MYKNAQIVESGFAINIFEQSLHTGLQLDQSWMETRPEALSTLS